MTRAALAAGLEHLGDWINPILVKETRQALKSRQFAITFMLLLLASLLVSFGGVMLAGPDLDYRSVGGEFFMAYFAVLGFAIFVVVPFGAYRSLAAEQEERTFELLSITTLRPAQIVGGKLLSAVIQMFIYYSAIAPFMAFTYLLKGIDVPSIGLVLFGALLASVWLSMVGLLLATLSNRRSWQVFLSVALIAGLLMVTFGSIGLAGEVVGSSVATTINEEFWVGMAALLTGYGSYFALAFLASTARLTFEADNRSSKLRAVLVMQFLAFLAWAGYGWVVQARGDHDYLVGMTCWAGVQWTLVGALLIGEQPGLSRRVRRQVPRSGPLRALTALLFPGPETGLGFLLVNLGGLVVMVALAEWTEPWVVANRGPMTGPAHPTLVAVVLASYGFFYTGLGALVVRAIRRFRPIPFGAGAAITVLLAGLGSLVPSFFAMVLPNHQFTVYRFWQVSDPIATVREAAAIPLLMPLPYLVVLPIGLAVGMFAVNLRAMARAVSQIDAAGRRRRGGSGESSSSGV